MSDSDPFPVEPQPRVLSEPAKRALAEAEARRVAVDAVEKNNPRPREVAGRKDDPRSRWVMSVAHRRHKNVAAVALANKMARIAWVLLRRGGTYNSLHGMTATA